jgi:YD repeat-containing protein
MTQKSTYRSNRDIIEERYQYPSNYTNLTSGNDYGIKYLQEKHLVEDLVEKSSYIKKSGESDYKLINSMFNSYYSNNGKPKIIYQIENNALLTNFIRSYSSGGNIIIDNNYKPERYFDSYDIKGNLLQTHVESSIQICYKYGYNNFYPISEVKNATTSECGYSGFENQELNDWSLTNTQSFINAPAIAKTGRYCVQGAGATRTFNVGLEAGKHSGYKASAWVKNLPSSGGTIKFSIPNTSIYKEYTIPRTTTDWQLIEADFPYSIYQPYLSSDLKIKVEIQYNNSSGYIDDVRFYPMDAQMTTYTYDPLIGVTSISDANNKPTTYEYDAFGRLNLVRDFAGYILKKYEYNYKH